MVVSNVVPQSGEIRGGDGLHPELLHRAHLDEELVHQQPEEDEEDAADLKLRPRTVSRFERNEIRKGFDLRWGKGRERRTLWSSGFGLRGPKQ